MIQYFDKFNRYEIPTMTLCQPNKTELYALGDISDRQLKLRLNALSEFSFTAKSKVKTAISGVEQVINTPYFSFLDYRRLVYIQDIGYFMITQIQDDTDGFSEIKKIVSQSLEVELNFKKLTVFNGYFKFYDFFDPNPTLMGNIMQYLPDWTLSEFDTELTTLYGTFNETDVTIYSFLMDKVSQTFNCIFTFDTINKTISVHTVANSTTNTDIYLSYDNLLENTNLKPVTEELVTALTVLGSDPLSIIDVNPLGTSTIYDFTFYKNTDWMSGSLVTAVTNWENLITSVQPTYADLLEQNKQANTLLNTQNSELTTLKGQLEVLETLRSVKIRQGLPIGPPDSNLKTEIDAKTAEINVKESQIVATEKIIDNGSAPLGLKQQIKAINTLVAFSTNFTPEEYKELSTFMMGSTYTNNNFVQYDNMSGSAIQEQAQLLYSKGLEVLAKVAEPRYTFEINAVNFLLLKEFQTFVSQLALGAVVTINISDDVHAYPAILGIEFDYDNPDQFKLILSNRLRLDDSAFQFSDLFQQSLSSGITTQFNTQVWGNFQKNYQNDVNDFIHNSFDVSAKAIVDAKNQSFVIDSNGIRGRYLQPSSTGGSPVFDDEQIAIINNLLVFTDNNWGSAKLALGKITTPSGVPAFGLVAEVIVGHLLISNELYVSNQNNTFTVNASGATLTNATFTLTGNQGANIIKLDPTVGIEISKRNSGGTFDRNFYVDSDGNVIFSGKLQAATGTFTGGIETNIGKIGAWTIDNYGLSDNLGNYIYGTGSVKLGKLEIEGDEAWFHGNFYAENLDPSTKFQAHQIGSLNADVINAGTIRGINIFGSNIYWPGVRMYSPFAGTSALEASNKLSFSAGNSSIFMVNEGMNLLAKQITMGSIFSGNLINLLGNIQTLDVQGNQGWAKTQTITVTTPTGDVPLVFVNGLLTDPFHYTESSGSSVAIPGWHKYQTLMSGSAMPDKNYNLSTAGAIYSGNLSGSPVEYYLETTGPSHHSNYSPSGVNSYRDVDTWGCLLLEFAGGNVYGSGGGREIRYDTGGNVIFNQTWDFAGTSCRDAQVWTDGDNIIMFFHKSSGASGLYFCAYPFKDAPFALMDPGWVSTHQPLPSATVTDRYQAWEFGIAVWY